MVKKRKHPKTTQLSHLWSAWYPVKTSFGVHSAGIVLLVQLSTPPPKRHAYLFTIEKPFMTMSKFRCGYIRQHPNAGIIKYFISHFTALFLSTYHSSWFYLLVDTLAAPNSHKMISKGCKPRGHLGQFRAIKNKCAKIAREQRGTSDSQMVPGSPIWQPQGPEKRWPFWL